MKYPAFNIFYLYPRFAVSPIIIVQFVNDMLMISGTSIQKHLNTISGDYESSVSDLHPTHGFFL